MTLTSKRRTEIADEEIDRMLSHEKEAMDAIYEDGGFIGDVALPAPERLDRYWLVTPDLSDLSLLIEPGAEEMIRQGLIPGPVNPYWKNLLREPGLFKEQAADFMRLNQRYPDRYQAVEVAT